MGRIWKFELSRVHLFQGQVDARNLVISPAQWSQHEQVRFGFWQNDPFPASGPDKGTNGKAHAPPPKMLGCRSMMLCQSSFTPKRTTVHPRSSMLLCCCLSRPWRSGCWWYGPST